MSKYDGIEVVVPTYKAASALRLVLEGLARQTYREFCVRVVCDGGDPELEKIVNEYEERIAVNFYYLPPRTQERRLSEAKNLGVQATESKRVLILDGDCIPGPSVVAAHAPYADKQIIACGVRYRITADVAATLTIVDFDRLLELSNRVDDRYLKTPAWRAKRFPDVKQMETGKTALPHLCHGFQVSYPISDFNAVRGFDPAFKFRQDQDVAQKLVERGCTTILLPNAVCYHLDHPMRDEQLRQRSTELYQHKWEAVNDI